MDDTITDVCRYTVLTLYLQCPQLDRRGRYTPVNAELQLNTLISVTHQTTIEHSIHIYWNNVKM